LIVRKSRKPATASDHDDSVASADVATAKARAIAWLLAHGSPRLMMSLMLASSIGCGFLASMTMHRIGLTAPLIRYPLVVLIAWAVFLFLIGVWVWWHRRESVQHVESADIGNQQPVYWSDVANSNVIGNSTNAQTQFIANSTTVSSSRRSRSGNWNLNLDGDDAGFIVLLLLVIAVTFAVLGLVFYAVYSAPTFFAELLIDGGVGTWLYKRMDVINSTDALSIAIKRSVWLAVILVALFVALALAMHYVAPEATTLGEAWRTARYER
jgi:hypothetical protein